jgi:ParB family chromosome partitioning protein
MQTQMVILLLAAAALLPDPQNPRKAVDSEELRVDLRLLGQDMKRRGVLVPLIVRRNGDVHVVIDGHRRLAAALLVGIDKLPCIVVEGNVTPEQALEIALITSLHKQDLSTPDKVRAYFALKRLHPGSTAKDLAARLSIHPSLASEYQCYEHCTPEVQKAFDDGKLVLKAMNAISRQPPEAQGELLEMALAGLPGAEVARRARTSGNGKKSKATVKVSRAVIEMGNAVVVVKRKNLDMSALIETLEECLKCAKADAKEKFDIKTFVQAMSARAKGGEHERNDAGGSGG